LRRMDLTKPLILHTDWSEFGISGVLGQLDGESRKYMVACVSQTLNVDERRYGAYRGELLAAVWAVQTLRPYLHGCTFTLVTDHGPLEWLMTQKDLTGQAARWALILQGYSFNVVHRPGAPNQNADALSRDPAPSAHDSAAARLDSDSDPVPPLPARVPYPGCEWPPHAAQPAFESAGGGGALATLASVLCIRQQEDWRPSVRPCVLASTQRVVRLQAARAVNLQVACVPDGEEMLAGHVGGVQDAAHVPPRVTDPSVPIATTVVRDARTALRFVALEPRLPLRLHPSTHESAPGPHAGHRRGTPWRHCTTGGATARAAAAAVRAMACGWWLGAR
jgi:hypothetical protein